MMTTRTPYFHTTTRPDCGRGCASANQHDARVALADRLAQDPVLTISCDRRSPSSALAIVNLDALSASAKAQHLVGQALSIARQADGDAALLADAARLLVTAAEILRFGAPLAEDPTHLENEHFDICCPTCGRPSPCNPGA
jgi:hypothetical protein